MLDPDQSPPGRPPLPVEPAGFRARRGDMSAMDTAVASSIRRDETVPVALLLAFAGGYLDAYTWIIHGVMANAQTANLVLLWVYGSIGEWTKALHFVPPIVAFAVGIVVASWLRRAARGRANAIGTLHGNPPAAHYCRSCTIACRISLERLAFRLSPPYRAPSSPRLRACPTAPS